MKGVMTLERRFRLAGIFLTVGLAIEATCLLWARPIAFVLMVVAGGLFCAIGIVVYLYSLVSARQD